MACNTIAHTRTPRISRWLTALLALTLLLSPAALTQAQELRIAAYNVENWFDVFDDPYSDDESTDVKTRAELKQIAEMIRHLDADVVGFCELESEGALKALVREMLPDMGYEYIAVSKTNSGRGIHIGVISRKPIVSVTSYRFQELAVPGEDRTWRFARDVPRFVIEAAPGVHVHTFMVHFKSKRDSSNDPDSNKWRRAEATRAWQLIDRLYEQDPDAAVILMGDLNDTPDSAPLQVLQSPGVTGEPALIDVTAGLPKEERITYLRPPYRSQIDYVLASPSLAENLVPGSVTIPTDEELLAGSDHAPVAATFNLAPLMPEDAE